MTVPAPARQMLGVSLLETLVALALLSTSLAAILGLFSTALRFATEADALTRATRAGEALLVRLGAEIPLEAGERSGALDGGLEWRLKIRDYRPGGAAPGWQMPLQAYWVELDVRRGIHDQGAVRLTALRLAPRGAASP